jgi:Fur family transcriptional regulator, peroxide stress response regulator
MILNMIKKRRKSKQREKIYKIIKGSTLHPTAQWIFDELNKEDPTLSLGNLYRNLSILVEEGSIKCKEFGDGIEHYDAIVELHYHFICNKCGKVSDFSMPLQENIIKEAQKLSKNSITGHTIEFYGICESCKIEEEKKIF